MVGSVKTKLEDLEQGGLLHYNGIAPERIV